jgi:hypothetical protein
MRRMRAACAPFMRRMQTAHAAHAPQNSIILFSDESRFCMGPDVGWVRVKRGNWNMSGTVETAKYPMGAMVWGCIGPGFKSELIVMSPPGDGGEYQRAVLGSSTCSLADALCAASGFASLGRTARRCT